MLKVDRYVCITLLLEYCAEGWQVGRHHIPLLISLEAESRQHQPLHYCVRRFIKRSLYPLPIISDCLLPFIYINAGHCMSQQYKYCSAGALFWPTLYILQDTVTYWNRHSPLFSLYQSIWHTCRSSHSATRILRTLTADSNMKLLHAAALLVIMGTAQAATSITFAKGKAKLVWRQLMLTYRWQVRQSPGREAGRQQQRLSQGSSRIQGCLFLWCWGIPGPLSCQFHIQWLWRNRNQARREHRLWR